MLYILGVITGILLSSVLLILNKIDKINIYKKLEVKLEKINKNKQGFILEDEELTDKKLQNLVEKKDENF